MKPVIRSGSPADAEAVARLQGQLFPDPWSVADVTAQISLPNAILEVATSAGSAPDLCGYALGQVAVDEVELRSIGILPQVQNQGLGRALLIAWEIRAKSLGANRVVLEVAANNMPARALYNARGYLKIGHRLGYYRTGRTTAIDALVLARALAD